jgi:DNA polymerase II small subunit/DNA polymerase delta subunit B
MKKAKKTLAEFETIHGGTKIKALERRLAAEHAKVEALADVQGKVTIERQSDCRIRFALTGDRHTGSLYHYGAGLAAFYEFAAAEGVECVYDCGDLLAGHGLYRGQEFELRDLGFEAQLDRLAKDAPRGIPTRFITGNHDASFKNACGVPVGKMIAQTIPEYTFLGEEQARVQFDTPNGPFVLGLVHPGGGSAYALSYKPQKIIESLEGGTKPGLLGIGHFHKAEMMPSYRNVCGIQAGTFERQTPFMARGGLAAHVGGWIIEVTVGNGHNRIKGEFVAMFA